MGRKRNLQINVGQQDALCSFWGVPPYLNLLWDSKGLNHASKPRHSGEWYPLRVAGTALLSDSPVAWAFGLDLLYSIALPTWAFWDVGLSPEQYSTLLRNPGSQQQERRKAVLPAPSYLKGKLPELQKGGRGFILVRSTDSSFYFHALSHSYWINPCLPSKLGTFKYEVLSYFINKLEGRSRIASGTEPRTSCNKF